MKGFHNKVMQVNLKQRSFEEQFADNEIYARLLGGKGLATHLLLNNTKAGIDPLSEDNVIIFATGGKQTDDTLVPETICLPDKVFHLLLREAG